MKMIRFILCLLIAACIVSAESLCRAESEEPDYCYEEYEELYCSVILRTNGLGAPDFELHSRAFRAMFITLIMDMEIQNGGIAQFFWNKGAAYAALVPESLRTVGLDDVAALYEAFLAEQGITLAEIDGYRTAYPDMVAVYETHPFDDFDDAYMKIWTETNINLRLLTYGAVHPEMLL